MQFNPQSLLKSKGLQQSVVMIFGNLFATGIAAISLIVISRMLGPSSFGEFSFGFSFILILVRINDLGLASALMKFVGKTTDNSKRNIYFSITNKIKLKVSLAIVLFGILTFEYLNNIFKLENPEILLISFIFGMSSVYLEQLSVMLQALHKFNRVVFSNIVQAFVKLAFTIGFLYLQTKNILVVFGAYAIAPIAPVLLFRHLLPKSIRLFSKSKGLEEKKELYGMAKHTGIANLANTLVSQASIIFVQAFLTSYETGLIGGVSKIQLLFSLIAISLGNVLFPRVARYNSKADLLKYIVKAFGVILLSIIGLIVSLLLAKTMILVTVGSEYLPGLNVLYILLISVFILIATVPFTALFYSYNKNIFFSISGFLQVILIIVGNMILLPKYGLIGTAYTQLSTSLALFMLTFIWSLSIYNRLKTS